MMLLNKMKETKNILIAVLLAGCMIFGFMWFFNGSGEYKEKIKQLEKEKKELEINTDIDIQAFESVDQIVSNEISQLDTTNFDKSMLLQIYNGLES